MPAGATFNRLHDVIQNVTNFQGGYPGFGYHLFKFDLTPEENTIITNMTSEMKTWADSLRFSEYDPDWINRILKSLSYKKTEWDKINHERYRIIEDKYRKK